GIADEGTHALIADNRRGARERLAPGLEILQRLRAFKGSASVGPGNSRQLCHDCGGPPSGRGLRAALDILRESLEQPLVSASVDLTLEQLRRSAHDQRSELAPQLIARARGLIGRFRLAGSYDARALALRLLACRFELFTRASLRELLDLTRA